MNRLPPDDGACVPVDRRDPNDPPLAGASAKKRHTDEELDFFRDEELLVELQEAYPWC